MSLTQNALQSQSEVVGMLEDENQSIEERAKYQALVIENMTSRAQSDSTQIELLKEEIKITEGELIEKDYQTELLTEKLKNLEDELKSHTVQIEQLNAKLRLKKEELSSKDDLLSDKFTVRIPTDESSFSKKFFGPSRSEFLEKQLIASKKASLAHQTHNAFLNMEVIPVGMGCLMLDHSLREGDERTIETSGTNNRSSEEGSGCAQKEIVQRLQGERRTNGIQHRPRI